MLAGTGAALGVAARVMGQPLPRRPDLDRGAAGLPGSVDGPARAAVHDRRDGGDRAALRRRAGAAGLRRRADGGDEGSRHAAQSGATGAAAARRAAWSSRRWRCRWCSSSAAGLFVRTFASLETRPLGFDRDRVLVAAVNAHSAAIEPSQRLPLYERARERFARCRAWRTQRYRWRRRRSTMISIIPVDSDLRRHAAAGHGADDARSTSSRRAGSARSARACVAGRDITDRRSHRRAARRRGQPAFARKYLNGASPLGHTIASTIGSRRVLSIEIVGVVEDAVYRIAARAAASDAVPADGADRLAAADAAGADGSERATGGAPPAQLAPERRRGGPRGEPGPGR